MDALPSLDAHAHLSPSRHPEPFTECGFVLAQTMSLVEVEGTATRSDADVTFGVGCHPRSVDAQAAFDARRFGSLMEHAALVGEIGLDGRSRVPWRQQIATFRAVLQLVARSPRLLSVHSAQSTRAALDELQRAAVIAPVLHRWTGSADETVEALALGCHFSVHAALARRPTWRRHVPLDRILVESDHGALDPPAAIPLRIGWVEHLVAQQYGIGPEEVRAQVWHNLARIVGLTGTRDLLPPGLRQRVDDQAAVSA